MEIISELLKNILLDIKYFWRLSVFFNRWW